MFDNLSERLERSFKILKGEGKITEINVAETLKDVRKALLDADVNYKDSQHFLLHHAPILPVNGYMVRILCCRRTAGTTGTGDCQHSPEYLRRIADSSQFTGNHHKQSCQ